MTKCGNHLARVSDVGEPRVIGRSSSFCKNIAAPIYILSRSLTWSVLENDVIEMSQWRKFWG
jgi:hypothetical protein